jgi:hypothetical protein
MDSGKEKHIEKCKLARIFVSGIEAAQRVQQAELTAE